VTSAPPGSERLTLWGALIRIAILVAIVVAATLAANALKEALNLTLMPANEAQFHRSLMLGMVAYVALLTVPFVPGAEIGFALLTMFGGAIAPLVYSATVLAMMLAFTLGHFVPVRVLAWALATLRLQRAAALMTRAEPLSREARVEMLLERAPPRLVALALRHRYVALALLVNTPGNSLIGGGGGIMMLAGISGLFAPVPTFLAVALAVAPVPVVVLLTGV